MMGRKNRVTIDDVMRSLEAAKAIRQDLIKLRKHLLLAAMKIEKILKET